MNGLSALHVKNFVGVYNARNQPELPVSEASIAQEKNEAALAMAESVFLLASEHPLEYVKVAVFCVLTLGIGTGSTWYLREQRLQKEAGVNNLVTLLTNKTSPLSSSASTLSLEEENKLKKHLTTLMAQLSLEDLRQGQAILTAVINALTTNKKEIFASVHPENRKETQLAPLTEGASLVVKAGSIFFKKDEELIQLISFGEYLNSAEIPSGNEADKLKANLHGLDLSGGNFSGWDLSNANLSHSNMRDTNLTGAIMTNVQLDGTQFNNNTKFDDAEITLVLPPIWSEAEMKQQVAHTENLFTSINSMSDAYKDLKIKFLRQAFSIEFTDCEALRRFQIQVTNPAARPYWRQVCFTTGQPLRAYEQIENNYTTAAIKTLIQYQKQNTDVAEGMTMGVALRAAGARLDPWVSPDEIKYRKPDVLADTLKANGYPDARVVKASSLQEYEEVINQAMNSTTSLPLPLIAPFVAQVLEGFPVRKQTMDRYLELLTDYQNSIRSHQDLCQKMHILKEGKSSTTDYKTKKQALAEEIKQTGEKMQTQRYQLNKRLGERNVSKVLPSDDRLVEFLGKKPEKVLDELSSHSCVITAYNPASGRVTIGHWGRSFETSVKALYDSSLLLRDRNAQGALITVSKPPQSSSNSQTIDTTAVTAVPSPSTSATAVQSIVESETA